MAPKLTPDNLTLPEQYDGDVGRHKVDRNIFPLPHSAGGFKDVGSRSLYVPAPAPPSPLSNERYITDIGAGSQFIKFYKDLTYQTSDVALAGDDKFGLTPFETMPSNAWEAFEEVKGVIAAETLNRSVSNGTQMDQEIIALGTGSSFPSKSRNGIPHILVR